MTRVRRPHQAGRASVRGLPSCDDDHLLSIGRRAVEGFQPDTSQWKSRKSAEWGFGISVPPDWVQLNMPPMRTFRSLDGQAEVLDLALGITNPGRPRGRWSVNAVY